MEELLPFLARCTGPDTYQIVLSAPTDPEEAEKRITLIRRGLALADRALSQSSGFSRKCGAG